MNDKKKTSTLKVERPSKEKPSTLAIAVAKARAPKMGRKPIPVEQRQSVSVNFKVTPAQYDAIVEQAGELVPVSAFIKAKLKKAGVF